MYTLDLYIYILLDPVDNNFIQLWYTCIYYQRAIITQEFKQELAFGRILDFNYKSITPRMIDA